jgi:hypothetical protein
MLRSAVTIAFCLFIGMPAAAITMAPLSFEQLVNNSAAVVLARVIDVRGDFIGAGRGIESVVTVSVLKGLKGGAAETLQFTVPGGRAGRYLNLIPGAPVFTTGDLAVVFLTGRGARLPITTGLTQGVYRVQPGSGEMMVMPPAIDNVSTRVARGDVQRKPVSLSTFEGRVRAIVEATASASSVSAAASADKPALRRVMPAGRE